MPIPASKLQLSRLQLDARLAASAPQPRASARELARESVQLERGASSEELLGEAWFYLGETGERQGPLETQELLELLLGGIVSTDTPVWSKGLGEWRQLHEVYALCEMAENVAPSAQEAWYYLDVEGAQQGPVLMDELQGMLQGGVVILETPVYSKSLGEWKRLSEAGLV